MSHSLHRVGRKRDLARDWIVLAMSARGVNRRGSAPRLRRFLRIALRHGPVSFGDMRTGSSATMDPGTVLDGVRDDSLLNVVFAGEAPLRAFLEALRRTDLGLSVVVSGLLDRGCRCAREAGLEPHTVALSLGIRGRTERLPDGDTLEIMTMCGHGLVSRGLVAAMAGRVASGERSVAAAAEELAKPCVCGLFNPVRAAAVLRRMANRRGLRGDGGPSRTRS